MATIPIGELVASLGLDIKKLKVSEKKAEKIIKSYSETVDKQLDKSDKRFKKHGKNIEHVYKAARGAFASFTAGLAIYQGVRIFQSIVEDGKNFEKTMAIVKGVSKATGEQFKEMSDLAKEMGATTEFTATQAGESLRFLTMAGVSAKESMKALPGTLDLATAGNIDLGMAADIASNAMTAMGFTANDLGRINDSFIATITRSNSTVEQLAESFKYVAPSAKAFGLSIEELNALLGKLHDAGIQGSMAGTQLNQALIRSAKVMDQIGKEGNVIDMLKHINKEGWTAGDVLRKFAGRGGRAVLVLRDMIPEIETLVGKLKNASGETQELADIMRNTTEGSIRELQSAIESVKIEAFEGQTSNLKSTIQGLTKTVRENKDEFITLGESIVVLGSVSLKTIGILSRVFQLHDVFVKKVDDISFAEKMKNDIIETEKEIDLLEKRQTRLLKFATPDKNVKLQIGDDLIREKQRSIVILKEQLAFYNKAMEANKKIKEDTEELNKIEEEKNVKKQDILKKEKEIEEAKKAQLKIEKDLLAIQTKISLQESIKIIDEGFDPYGSLVKGIRDGKEAYKLFLKELEVQRELSANLDDTWEDWMDFGDIDPKIQELGEHLRDTVADVTHDGLVNGFESAAQMAANILGSAVQQTLVKEIGGIGGGLLGGLVGGGISLFASSLLGGGSKDRENELLLKQMRNQTEETEKNTEAILRHTDFLKNEFTAYSSSIFSASESLLEVSTTFREHVAGGGDISDLSAVGAADVTIGALQKQLEYINFLIDNNITVGVRNLAETAALLEADIDGINASVEEFRTIINNIQLDIGKAAANILEDAYDAFRSEADIQRRNFNKSAKELLIGLAETFEAEGIISGEWVEELNGFNSAADISRTLLDQLTKGSDAYNQVMEMGIDLTQAAILHERARAEAIRDSMMVSLGGLSSIFDEIDFKLSGMSRQNWIESRIDDFEEIFDVVGKLTEDQFGKALGYVSNWYDAVVANEQAAAQAWLDVTNKVENLSNSIETTVRNIRLGSLNVSLSGAKTAQAGQDYQLLLEAAKTGDQDAINEFIGFSSQYLQVAQDTFKSSEKYREIYKQVMDDMSALNTFIQTEDYRQLTYDEIQDTTAQIEISNDILEGIRSQMGDFYEQFLSYIEPSTAQPAPPPYVPPEVVVPPTPVPPTPPPIYNPPQPPIVAPPTPPPPTSGLPVTYSFSQLAKMVGASFPLQEALNILGLASDMDQSEGITYLGKQLGLPGYKKGGMAFTPQLATLAEQGPEVVLDKSDFDSMKQGGNNRPQQINVYLDGTLIDTKILRAIDNNNVNVRRRGGNAPGRLGA